jgi:hypothetical protein
MGIAGKVVSILSRARRFTLPPNIPEPPPLAPPVDGGYALYMDEDEATILYAKALVGRGIPTDERTNSTMWLIDGQYFGPSRQDGYGNWIFRRVTA